MDRPSSSGADSGYEFIKNALSFYDPCFVPSEPYQGSAEYSLLRDNLPDHGLNPPAIPLDCYPCLTESEYHMAQVGSSLEDPTDGPSTLGSHSQRSNSQHDQISSHQSLITSKTPPTPPSEPLYGQTPSLNDLPDINISDGSQQHQILQGLDPSCQGHQFPLHVDCNQYSQGGAFPNYLSTSSPVDRNGQQNPNYFEALSQYTPRSYAPWSKLNPRIGDPSPGAGVMVRGLQPYPFHDSYRQRRTHAGINPHSSTEQMPSDIRRCFANEEPVPNWPHQVSLARFLSLESDNGRGAISDTGSDFMSSQSPSSPTHKNKGGRRHGYRLNRSNAANAKQIRQIGSCWHCYLMKKKCSAGTPCDACRAIGSRHGFRTFPLHCFREMLQERRGLLLPDALTSHLDEDVVSKFCSDNISCIVRYDFDIKVSVGYGQEFQLDALSFLPTSNLELTHTLAIDIDEKSGTSSRTWQQTPFISLHLADNSVLVKVQDWLDDVLFTHLEGWPDFSCGMTCFNWQRGVMMSICRFFTRQTHNLFDQHSNQNDWPPALKTLRISLELSLLIFIMGHQLMIPEEEILRLAGILNRPLPAGRASCRLLNKIFKMMLVPMVKALAYDSLEGLNKSFRSNGASDWGCDFCIVILLLIVSAENQISLDDIAACAWERGDRRRSRELAAAEIQELESNLPDVLIGLFDAKYKSHRDHFNPFRSYLQGTEMGSNDATKDLVRDISAVFAAERSSVFLSSSAFPPRCRQLEFGKEIPKLADLHPDELAASNVARILLKFLNPFFQTRDAIQQRSLAFRKHRNEGGAS